MLLRRAAGWTEARRMTEESDLTLPSHNFLDKVITRHPELKDTPVFMGHTLYWAKEVVAYPYPFRQFVDHRDIVDPFRDSQGRSWVIPAACVPWDRMIWASIRKIPIILFINPSDVEAKKSSVVIHCEPQQVELIGPSVQISGGRGVVDPHTGMPKSTWVPKHIFSKEDLRRLWRLPWQAIRPLARGYSTDFEKGRDIFASLDPCSAHEVACEKHTLIERWLPRRE